MASDHSFDIVSEIDKQELVNALDQTRKEISVRFDFRNVPVEIENKDGKELVITTENENRLKAIREIMESKMFKRGLDLKVLGPSKEEPAAGGKLRSTIPLVAGISAEKAKPINKLIRDHFPKVKPQIQGETIRVVSSSIDDLQGVMQLLKNSEEIDLPLQFVNYR